MRLKMLSMGNPKTGKTGSLAALLNAGWNVRYVDLDGNVAPLLAYTKEDKKKHLSVFSPSSKYKMETVKVGMWNGFDPTQQDDSESPDSWTQINIALFSPERQWSDGSLPTSWKADTDLLVIDSLTALGDQFKAWWLAKSNTDFRGDLNYKAYGAAYARLQNFIMTITNYLDCSFLFITHENREDDFMLDDQTDVWDRVFDPNDSSAKNIRLTYIKNRIQMMEERMGKGFRPTFIGRKFNNQLPKLFNSIISYHSDNGRRYIQHFSDKYHDLNCLPFPMEKKPLPIESGLEAIFSAAKKHQDFA